MRDTRPSGEDRANLFFGLDLYGKPGEAELVITSPKDRFGLKDIVEWKPSRDVVAKGYASDGAGCDDESASADD